VKLTLGLLADFANKSSDGKLNILGAFTRIWADRYPATHPEMKLVLRFEIHPAELGQTKKIQIQLRDENGRQIFELSGDMNLRQPPPEALPRGQMMHSDQILGLNRLTFAAPGRYEFVVLVNGEIKGEVPFTVALRDAKPLPPKQE
jgi:hypothetical protein